MTDLIAARSVWGSTYDYAARHLEHPADPAKVEAVLHHSDTIAPDLVIPWDDEYRAMRLLEQIGVQRFESGMSYNVAVMPTGNAYEGQPLANKSTHSAFADWNYTRASIVLVGNYETNQPTEAMLRTVALIQAFWKAAGTITTTDLRWHGQVQSTACPGRNVIARIPDINDLAHQLEDDMALFANKADFRNEVRTAVQGEMEEQRPAWVAEITQAVVDTLRPMIPPVVDTDALVAEVLAGVGQILPAPLDPDVLTDALVAKIAQTTFSVTHDYTVTPKA